MNTFTQYLAESVDTEYSKFLKNLAKIEYLTDRTYGYVEELEDRIVDGKPLDSVFRKFDPVAAAVFAYANKDKAGRYEIESKQALETLKKYTELKSRYQEKAKCFTAALNCVAKGDKQEDAVKKLVAATKKLKYFDIKKGTYTVNFFDQVTAKDILHQIDHFKGLVQIHGAMDLNVVFENGKVRKVYF